VLLGAARVYTQGVEQTGLNREKNVEDIPLEILANFRGNLQAQLRRTKLRRDIRIDYTSGYRAAGDPQFGGMSFQEAESRLRADLEQDHPPPTSRVRNAIRLWLGTLSRTELKPA